MGTLRHKLFRHVDGNTTPARATVQDITLMLFARLARRAILADAPATPQAQRTDPIMRMSKSLHSLIYRL